MLPSLIYYICMTLVMSMYLYFPRPFPFSCAGGYRAFLLPSATVARAKWYSCLQSYGVRSSSMQPLSLANWRNESTTRSVVHQLLSLNSLLRGQNSPDTASFMSPESSTCCLFHSYIAPFSLVAPLRGSASKTVSPSTSGGSAINQTQRQMPLLSRAFTSRSSGL